MKLENILNGAKRAVHAVAILGTLYGIADASPKDTNGATGQNRLATRVTAKIEYPGLKSFGSFTYVDNLKIIIGGSGEEYTRQQIAPVPGRVIKDRTGWEATRGAWQYKVGKGDSLIGIARKFNQLDKNEGDIRLDANGSDVYRLKDGRLVPIDIKWKGEKSKAEIRPGDLVYILPQGYIQK